MIEAFDDSVKPMKALAEKVEEIIGKILAEYGEKSSILLIGRYNYDMYKLYKAGVFAELPNNHVKSEKYPNADITFMTAHSSKGLGYHPTLDHIRPLSNGGCDMPENIVICHRDTNEEKADLFPHWMANGKRFHARRVRGSRVEYEIVED